MKRDALMPIMTVQELDWDSEHYSNLAAASQLIAGLIGMILGGWIAQKWGLGRALAIYLVTLGVASMTMGVLPGMWENELIPTAHMLIHHSCRTLALIICFSIGMALCWKPVAASQFAFYMAFGNLGISSGFLLLGQLTKVLSSPQIFFSLAAVSTLGLAMVPFLKIEAHRQRIESFRT